MKNSNNGKNCDRIFQKFSVKKIQIYVYWIRFNSVQSIHNERCMIILFNTYLSLLKIIKLSTDQIRWIIFLFLQTF